MVSASSLAALRSSQIEPPSAREASVTACVMRSSALSRTVRAVSKAEIANPELTKGEATEEFAVMAAAMDRPVMKSGLRYIGAAKPKSCKSITFSQGNV